eukprot:1156013-Pelagomonas_calceolata.AAC.6
MSDAAGGGHRGSMLVGPSGRVCKPMHGVNLLHASTASHGNLTTSLNAARHNASITLKVEQQEACTLGCCQRTMQQAGCWCFQNSVQRAAVRQTSINQDTLLATHFSERLLQGIP